MFYQKDTLFRTGDWVRNPFYGDDPRHEGVVIDPSYNEHEIMVEVDGHYEIWNALVTEIVDPGSLVYDFRLWLASVFDRLYYRRYQRRFNRLPAGEYDLPFTFVDRALSRTAGKLDPGNYC